MDTANICRTGVGAHAINTGGPRIDFCSLFFHLPSLDRVKAQIDEDPTKEEQSWTNQGSVFLHEMTHLDAVADVSRADYSKSGQLLHR